ncbi:MAG: succinyl-diaminopimelate desuccinylase [Candidatus Midichloria sp.]|nr:succinyl-diaminopimelate desuccinylase [Hyalomma marginatum]
MRQIELLQQLIRFKSITPTDNGCLKFLDQLLQDIGFECHLIKFQEEGLEPVQNLYARLGKKGRNFCFAGHVDVVPPGKKAEWYVPPFSGDEVDGYIYGRGAVDMKGALAAFIEAVRRGLDQNIINQENSISLLLTADEEGIAINGTKKMVPWLESRNERIDLCIIGEPTSTNRIGDTIKIGARGSITLTIEVIGKQGHVAYNQLAENPIPILANIIKELKSISLDNGNLHFQPSNLEFTNLSVGNEAENVIPSAAKARCNIRFGNMHTSKSLVAWVEKICEKYTNNFHLKWHSSGEAFITNYERLAPIVTAAIKEVANIDPQINTLGGTSDARFLTRYCPTVEIGLLNKTAHQINECVSLEDLELLTSIYLKILQKCDIFK